MNKSYRNSYLRKQLQAASERMWESMVKRTSAPQSAHRPRWDKFRKCRMYVPYFVYGRDDIPDGELIGTCRGDGVISGDVEDYQETIGIYSEEGVLYNILIDPRVECVSMQFDIEGTPFFFPIIGYLSLGGGVPCVDPRTGTYYERQR